MLHGGLDASATFQFLVDSFRQNWLIFAPDWRGHGRSESAKQGYWFPDYLADLDSITEQLFRDKPVPIIGHSLGGNVACIYAGLRPERVSYLVSLDGFGLPDRGPEEAPGQLRRWLDSWREPCKPHKVYGSIAEMAARLREANPRLDEGKSLFLATELTAPSGDGFVWAFDPRHRAPFGMLHKKAEWAASLAQVRGPTLFIGSDRPFPPSLSKEPEGLAARVSIIPGAVYERVEGAGHNLHHDEPEAVASIIERFLASN
jgi:pimeloyl-ACP methyl ester carboxylesterase